MSLDDIWDEPLIESTVGPNDTQSAPAPISGSRTPRSALFLSDSEDDDTGNVSRRPRVGRNASPPLASPSQAQNGTASSVPLKAQLDSIFADLDDDDPFGNIAPAIDVEGLKRQADAKVAAAAAAKSAAPSGSAAKSGFGEWNTGEGVRDGDKGRKAKRAMPKMDAERLLGPDGIPRLLKEYKKFKVTGKGNESADLDRLFRIYHAWTHKMFPKYQFSDTVERVERLCRSRRMTVNLKVWRNQAHGITPQVRHEASESQGDNDDIDLGGNDSDIDSEKDGENGNEQSTTRPPRSTSASDPRPGWPSSIAQSPSSSRPSTPVTRPGSAVSTAPSVRSSVIDIDNNYSMNMDIDALLREEEEIMREMQASKGKGGSSYKPSSVEDDDDHALWAAAGELPTALDVLDIEVPTQPESGLIGRTGEADDEEMWDIIDELKGPARSKDNDIAKVVDTVPTSEPVDPGPSAVIEPTIGADWEDMYE